MIYCGKWDYTSHVDQAIEKIEEVYAGEFNYYLFKDTDIAGRLEVGLFKGITTLEACQEGNTILVHSKAGGGGYPKDNWQAFLSAIETALKWQRWCLTRLLDWWI